MDRSKGKGVERKQLNGKPNPKYVDLLEEDKPIAGQKIRVYFILFSRKNSQGKAGVLVRRIPKGLGFQ